MTSAATTGAVVAAAAAKKRMQEEEDRMTAYTREDLEGWEFKIVRSAMGRFRNPETLRQLCLEEAEAGWEMLEKFDSYRVRFKRRTQQRAADGNRQRDPYRTQVGKPEAVVALIVILSIAAAIGLVILLTAALSN